MRFPTWKEVESDPEFQSLDTAKKKDYFGKWSRTAVDRAMQQGLYRDEEFASGFTGWYNQKAKEYGDEEEFADFGQLSKRKLKPEVGVFEGIANAAQNAFASSQQAIKTVGGVTPEEAKEISKLEFEKKAREVSPDYKAYQDAEGMDAVKAFVTNPFEVTTNIVAEGLSGNLPALGTGLAAGTVGAAIGAPTVIGAPAGFLGGQIAGTFAGSLATEYGGKMLEELQNAGMDINNPDSITEFFSNQKLVDEAKDKALKRGVPVAAFDALSAGIGGKVAKITKAAFKTPVREVAAETAIQAALGGGGEVAGSLAAGEEIRPKDVFAEIVGEVGPGAAEIAIGKVQQGFAERRKQRQLQEAAKVASNLENNNAPLTAQAVTVTSAKDALQQEKQTNEQTETELAQEREKFAPKPTVYEVPAKEEFKTTFAKMSPESIAQTERGFREELESEDADTRAFAQAGLDALAEFRAGVAPTPITVPPVEEAAPAVAAVTQPAAPAAPITPAAPEELAAPQRTIAESIRDKDTFVFNGMRGAISVEDGVTVFRPFATAEKYEVPVNPNQPISEIEGVEWVRKGQTRQAPAEPALPQVASVIESKPQVTEEEIAATEDDFEIPQALIEIENSPTLNAIADIFDVGESKLVKEGKRSVKISSTPEFYTQISPEQIEVANRQIDTALRVIDRLPISEEQKQALAEPYLLIDQDITNYESNPKYQQYKSSLRREVRPSGEAVAFPETISEVESGVQELERRERAAQPAAAAPQPVAAEPITSADAQVINNLRSVAENTAKREQISALSAAGLVDIIKGQPVINQDGEAILSRAQAPLPRLTPAERVAEIQAAPAPAPAPVAPAVTTPPAPEAAPEGIAVGNRIKLGKSPQTYVVEKVIPQTATERDLGEQYYSVKNERTGEVQVVEKNDVKPVKAKGVRRMAIQPQAIKPRTQEEQAAFDKASSNRVMARNPQLAVAAVRMKNKEITVDEYANLVGALDPFVAKGPDPIPTDAKIKQYIQSNKIDQVGLLDKNGNSRLQEGSEYEFRIDIPTYNKSTEAGDTVYAITAHLPVADDSKKIGDVVAFTGIAKVTNPRFMTRNMREGGALTIAMGAGKFRLATVKGNYEPIAELPADINDPNVWTEVGYNPIRSSQFIDVRSKRTVVGGDEAIMVGSRVFVKNPKTEARPTGIIGPDQRYMAVEPSPVQESNRYTYEQILVAAKKFFGGKAPANLTIVNDSTDPDYRFKAGYNLETGQIILNQAYLSKEDNIADNIAHELGHFVYGDPEVQAAFKEFWNALSPEQQAQADDIIRRHYSEESQSVQMEENQVRAFGTLIAENRIAPKWERFVNAVKAVLNRLVGTKFRLTDRGAQAVLSSAIKRFQSGERIIREMDAGIFRMAAEPEAAVEAEPTVEPAAEAPQKKPRPTTIQRLIEATTGVKRKRDLLTINEKTALKDQLKLGAKKRRLDAAQQKEFVKDLTAQLREETIRGRVKAPQLRAIVNKAMQVRFDNDASILSFLNYANKVIDNANYDRDVSDAKKAISSAKNLAKQKDIPAPVKDVLKEFAGINPREINNPGEFAAVLTEYMKGYGPVTAEDYVVIPDAEMQSYLNDLYTEIDATRQEAERQLYLRALSQELGREGITEDEAVDLLDMSEEEFTSMIEARKQDARDERRVKRAEALEAAINKISEEAQIALVNYKNPNPTDDTTEILDDMKRLNLSQLDVGARKEFIRAANSILVNNYFFGAQKFSATAKGQMGAAEAANDPNQIKRNEAMFNFLNSFLGERTGRALNLSVQSVADTFRNIAGKNGAPRLLVQMGMARLSKGTARANKINAEISDGIRERYLQIEDETKQKISDKQGMFSMGVAGNLIQIDPDETEAEGIQRIRKLIEEDIAVKERSPSRSDRESVPFIKKALDEVYADSVQGILENLKRTHIANYEALIFLKDQVLPEYKPMLKEHDELFNNQTDNYNNPNYLPIRYRQVGSKVKPPDKVVITTGKDVSKPKQAANSIKRKKVTVLPKDSVIDYNLTKNVLNSLSDQISKANTNAAWQQIIAFLDSPDAEKAVGGAENLDFLNRRLAVLSNALARTYDGDGGSAIANTIANVTRRFGIGLALGGYGQFFKQYPSQMATTLANVGDPALIAESTRDLSSEGAMSLLRQYSIGERGEIAGGTKWINQTEGNYGKIERFVEDGRWVVVSDAVERLNNVWLYALKKSDFLAAGSGWLSYYRKYLQDKGVEFTGWENESRLNAESDPIRLEAAMYAEQMIDMYQGSSDPTRMAELSQRGNNGYANLFKAIFMPFYSFVLQERLRMFSDARDAIFGDSDQRKAAAKGLSGTIAGMITFNAARRFLLPAVYGLGASTIYALLGVDMDEPDEEKQKEEANLIWRKFRTELFSNIVLGGFPEIFESKAIDSINYMQYIIESQIENENALDDSGEVMPFDKYMKDRAFLYRYTGKGSGVNLGMLEIMPGQFAELSDRVKELSSQELADTLTPEERRVMFVAGVSELLYTMRLNDTDVARMIRQMNKDVIEQGKEREKAEKRLQNLYK